MNKQKQHTQLLWWMTIIAIAHIGLIVWDIHTTLKSIIPGGWSQPADLRQQIIRGNIRHGSIVLSVMIIEAAIYWWTRRKATAYGFAKVHIGSLAVALVVLPVIMNTTTWSVLYYQIESDTAGVLYRTWMKLYWITGGISQLFFVLHLIGVFCKTEHAVNEQAMVGRSEFTAPIWWLGGLLLIVVHGLEYWITSSWEYALPYVLRYVVMATILVLESLLYYRLRYWIEQKRAAWLHVVLLWVGWIVVPIVLPMILVQFVPRMSRDTWEVLDVSLRWVFTIAAHVCLIIACRGAGRRRKEASLSVGSIA